MEITRLVDYCSGLDFSFGPIDLGPSILAPPRYVGVELLTCAWRRYVKDKKCPQFYQNLIFI